MTTMPPPAAGATPATEPDTLMTQPIIVDLGREKARKIRDLKRGEGDLWDEVLDVIDEVKDMLGEEAEGKTLVPIILLYQKKSRRQRIEKILFPLADWDDDDDDDDDEDDD
jgi:hypothetical protein